MAAKRLVVRGLSLALVLAIALLVACPRAWARRELARLDGGPGSFEKCFSFDTSNAFEPSGLGWHHGLQRLFAVSSLGELASFDEDGSDSRITALPVAGLEALTIINPDISTELYLGQQFPAALLEYSITEGMLTGRLWALPAFPSTPESGLGGLTFVVFNTSDHAPGLFYACSQVDGNIYAYAIDLFNVSIPARSVLSISTPWSSGCSGMHYEPTLNSLFAISDVNDEILEYKWNGTLVSSAPLPHANQQGLTMRRSSAWRPEVYITDNKGLTGSHIWRYAYPIPNSCF